MSSLLKSIIFSAVFAAGLTACSDEPAPLPADTSTAIDQGRADAKALSEARFTTERDLHAALLSVKAREWNMRRNGDTLSAAAYIRSFRQYLEETDNALANKVF